VKPPPEGGGGPHAKRRKNVRRKRLEGPKHVLEENIGEAFNKPFKRTEDDARKRARKRDSFAVYAKRRATDTDNWRNRENGFERWVQSVDVVPVDPARPLGRRVRRLQVRERTPIESAENV
tara:strand:- start:320 stop:682 length:363 start_codon:yes stop_codon:yes gene_type:complete